jgi:hypothetical protein
MARARTYLLGEFPAQGPLFEAVRALRAEGLSGLDLHSPYPLHGAEAALGLSPSGVPWMAFGAGLAGGLTGYLMQWFFNAVDYPLNVGNRLAHSPLANIPITFELTILFTSLSLFFGLLAFFFRFPRPHHPVFEWEAFRSATTHGLWLSAELPGVDEVATARWKARLVELGGQNVAALPEEVP